jgi:glycosyltransferase involved in cell wall biosynthesis
VALAEMGTVDILGSCRGALVPEDNPVLFAQSLTRILHDPDLRRRLGEEGRAYAAEWSEDTLAGRLADLYRKIVATHLRQRLPEFNLLPL